MQTSSGCSKIAVIDFENKKVYKFDSGGRWIDAGDNVYYWYSNNNFNYCEDEYKCYERAKKLNIGEFFANTKKIIDNNNLNVEIYEQEFVDCVAEVECSYMKEYSPEAEKFFDELKGYEEITDTMSRIWLEQAYTAYGKEKILTWLEFMIDYDLYEDMHDYNYGYRASDNTPCILDFSGYEEDTTEEFIDELKDAEALV